MGWTEATKKSGFQTICGAEGARARSRMGARVRSDHQGEPGRPLISPLQAGVLWVGVWGWPWAGASEPQKAVAPTHFHSTSSCSLMVPSSVMSTTITCGLVVKKSVMSHVTEPTASELRPLSSVTWGVGVVDGV